MSTTRSGIYNIIRFAYIVMDFRSDLKINGKLNLYPHMIDVLAVPIILSCGEPQKNEIKPFTGMRIHLCNENGNQVGNEANAFKNHLMEQEAIEF